jgi:DNA-directed RNA polymerase specialized sigma24 family protein
VHGRTPRRRHGAAQHLTADAGVEDRLRELAPRVLGVLVRRDEDFAGCEDAVQEALVAAAQHWPKEGVPGNPRSWLVTAASRAVVDEWRSVRARRRREEAVAALEPPDQAAPSGQDDSLALLLMCCHPVLPVPSQLALTLRAVGGVAPLVDVLTEAPGVGVPAVADPMVPLEHRALRLGPQQGDLGILLGRTVAVLDQPAGRQQATQRPPPADHVEVDVGAVAGDDVAEVLGVPIVRTARSHSASPWPPSDQSRMPVTSSPSTKMWQTCRSPCMNTGVDGRSAPRRAAGCG